MIAKRVSVVAGIYVMLLMTYLRARVLLLMAVSSCCGRENSDSKVFLQPWIDSWARASNNRVVGVLWYRRNVLAFHMIPRGR